MMTDQEFMDFSEKVIHDYKGQMDVLYSALGVLLVGRQFGWKVMRLTVSSRTYFKYQKVLGIDFKDELKPLGDLYHKSIGFEIVNGFHDFWDVVKGKSGISIERADRKGIS